MNQNDLKRAAGMAAIQYVEPNTIIGVGTGSTVNHFIDGLAEIKDDIKGAVVSSEASEKRLKKLGIEILDLNMVGDFDIYIDGADEINGNLEMIKGGGGALTREKIVAACAKKIICIADQSKKVDLLGAFPLAVEVIPMARSLVAREMVKLGGQPIYREGFVTDNGNVILDVWNLKILEPTKLEQSINNITGVVANGLFAMRKADVLLLAKDDGVETITS